MIVLIDFAIADVNDGHQASILEGDAVSPRMASASAQEEIDEITRKFLRPRGDTANMHFELLA